MAKTRFSSGFSQVGLSPMLDWTDVAFRILASKHGCKCTCSEMQGARSILHGSKASIIGCKVDSSEYCGGVQVFDNNPEFLAKSVKLLCDKVDCGENSMKFVCLNAGCSSSKMITQGMGADLMKSPRLIGEIVSAMKRVSSVPIVVKMRLGFTKENFLEVGKVCEDSGADGIVLHARLSKQGYSGKADWSKVRILSDSLSIPVVGNGDVSSLSDGFCRIKDYGVYGVWVGRCAMGNPLFFSKRNVDVDGRVKAFFEYVSLSKELGIFSLVKAKLYACRLSLGLSGACSFRSRVCSCKDFSSLNSLILGLSGACNSSVRSIN